MARKPKKTDRSKNRKPIASDIGTYLKNLRVEKNLTAQDVATKLNLAPRTILNIENGYNHYPSAERLKLWMLAMGYRKKIPEALAFLAAIKSSRRVTYLPRNEANEHIDRIIDAYESNALTVADLNLLKMVAPGEYSRA